MNSYILLDRSGSMASLWDEMLNALDAYATDLKGSTFLRIAAFDSTDKMQYFNAYKGKAKKFNKGCMETVRPRGGTPLYDAVGRLSVKIAKDSPKKAQIVIITDGYENSSRNLTSETVAGIVGEWEERGYDVIFMGASFNDVYKVGASMGIKHEKTINMTTSAHVGQTMSMMSARATAYDKGEIDGGTRLSARDRSAAGEK